jgi:CBS domain-containing protein
VSVELELGGLKRNSKIITIANLNPVPCKTSEKIFDAFEKIVSTGHRRLPIISGKNNLEGIITITDLLDVFLRKEDLEETLNTIMIREIITCKEDDTIDFVLKKIKLSKRGTFPIVDVSKKLVGLVSERDFVKYFPNVNFGIKIKDVMTRKPFFISPEISILDCLKTVVNVKYRRLPVVKGKKLIGIVTSTDILKYIKDQNYDFNSLDETLDPLIIKDVFTTSKENDLSDAIKIIKSKDIGGILIVNGQKNLEGIITERDILEEID